MKRMTSIRPQSTTLLACYSKISIKDWPISAYQLYPREASVISTHNTKSKWVSIASYTLKVRGNKHLLHQLLPSDSSATHIIWGVSPRAKQKEAHGWALSLIKLTKIHRIATVITLQVIFRKTIPRRRNRTSLMNLQTGKSTYSFMNGIFQVGYLSI